MSEHMQYLAMICYWIGGFLTGYGVRGFVFKKQKHNIVESMMTEFKKRGIKFNHD